MRDHRLRPSTQLQVITMSQMSKNSKTISSNCLMMNLTQQLRSGIMSTEAPALICSKQQSHDMIQLAQCLGLLLKAIDSKSSSTRNPSCQVSYLMQTLKSSMKVTCRFRPSHVARKTRKAPISAEGSSSRRNTPLLGSMCLSVSLYRMRKR